MLLQLKKLKTQFRNETYHSWLNTEHSSSLLQCKSLAHNCPSHPKQYELLLKHALGSHMLHDLNCQHFALSVRWYTCLHPQEYGFLQIKQQLFLDGTSYDIGPILDIDYIFFFPIEIHWPTWMRVKLETWHLHWTLLEILKNNLLICRKVMSYYPTGNNNNNKMVSYKVLENIKTTKPYMYHEYL